MEKSKTVVFKVYGKYALFSDPLTKVGGEKFSYQVPTYQALKGILESVYWKPTFKWVIDSVKIINPIRTQSKGIRPIKYNNGGNDLSIYTYLKDPCYVVKAHFEWNKNRPELKDDRNENKHYAIATRMIERGGRRDIFLGTRECQGYVEPCNFDEEKSVYDEVDELAFGVVFHSFLYPDENENKEFQSLLWVPKMQNGIINFCTPEQCTMKKTIGKHEYKMFIPEKNFQSVDLTEEEIK